MKSYAQFRNDIGFRESSGNYQCKNKWGYLGKYQFGMARLFDLGLCTRTPKSKKFKWIDGLTEKIFLNSTELQDMVFDKHVSLYREKIIENFKLNLGQSYCKILLTLSGAIACCHLLGLGGLRRFISGKDGFDGLGTRASEYVKLFENYDIPEMTVDLVKIIGNIRKSG